MRFEQIHVDSFGTLRGFHLALQPGVNILEGGNEAGKSTLCAFLTYMLYGLPKAEREKYFSWETGTMGGYLMLTDGSHTYRIERMTSPAGRETLKVIDCATNTQCFQGEVPGERLLGLPETLFTRTAYVSQTDGATVAGGDLSEAIGNLLFSGNEAVNTQKVLKKLDDSRISLLHKNKKGGLIFSIENECDDLRDRIARASAENAEIIVKESSLEETEKALAASEQKNAALTVLIESEEASALAEQFDRLREAEADRDRALARMHTLQEENRFGDFLPDAAYCDRLKTAIGERERAVPALHAAEEAADEAEQQEKNIEEREAFLRHLDEGGGGRKIIESCRVAMQKSKRMRRLGFLTLLLVIPAILFFRRAKKAKEQAEAILSSFHCTNLAQLTARMEYAAADADRLASYHRNVKMQYERLAQCRAEAGEAERKVETLAAMWGREEALTASTDAASFLASYETARAAYERASALADGLGLPLRGRDEQEIRSRLAALKAGGVSALDRDMLAVRREYEYSEHAICSLREKKYDTEKKLIELRAKTVSPAALQDQLNVNEERLHRLQRRHRALLMAYSALESAAGDLRESVSPTLSASAGKMMKCVTGGKYEMLGVARDMSMEYTARGEDGGLFSHSVEVLSAGTRDVAYVALRLALVQLLCSESMPPIVFDESFSRLDDKRLQAMLTMIAAFAKKGNQVLLLTSSGRDAAAAGKDPVFSKTAI